MRPGSGQVPAKVMVVGEAWGAEEERRGQPFMGASGHELDKMLAEAGMNRSTVYTSNLINARPQDNDIGIWIPLKKKDIRSGMVGFRDRMVDPCIVQGFESLRFEIDQVKPNVIIPVGNTSMWALTGKWGITKWRGSLLRGDWEGAPKVIPTFHPAAVLRQWDWRAITIRDLRRAAAHQDSREYSYPQWDFLLRPSFDHAIATLQRLYVRLFREQVWIDVDIETRGGHIACLGLSWSMISAICIPFMCMENREGYWSEEEEAAIVHWCYRILTHQNARIRWQNGLYDAQYIFKHWHFLPRGAQDTMISQHTTFVTQPKRLDFQASMYCENYVFWKDDGKTWDPKMGEEQLWGYNCTDCVRTREVGEVEQEVVASLGMEAPHDFQQHLFWPVLHAMCRGVKVDAKRKDALGLEIQEEVRAREQFFLDVLGHPLNVKSPKQMMQLFYGDLGQPPIMSRGKKGAPSRMTCDDDALRKIGAREPILLPIVNAISDVRTLSVFNSTFLQAKLGDDGRMRTSFNICGTKTLRFSSSEDAFGSGANLENIPSDKSKTMGKAKARGMAFQLPNIRSLYIPDQGMTFFDLDLDRADLHAVVWECNDELLKASLIQGADIHLLNVYSLDGKEPPPLEELVETHPKYMDHRGPRKHEREFAKVFCHATNYGGRPPTIAAATGRSVHEIDRAQKVWFSAHPKILSWQKDVVARALSQRYIENPFGYRWYIFDRVESIVGELLAWGPQSTVACVINRIWVSFWDNLRDRVEVLLQVHDSLAGQFPTHLRNSVLQEMQNCAKITIPYADPLVIPVGIKTSQSSWGDCR